MYTFLVGKDNYITATNTERIVQKSKLVNIIKIYVADEYNGINMKACQAIMYYRTPVSEEWKPKDLTPSEELYKGKFVEYLIPVDTWLTAEAGDVQFEIKFYDVSMGGEANVSQYVRKATNGIIHISCSKDWGSGIADSMLDAIDQRIIQLMMAQARQEEMIEETQTNCAASLEVTDGKLHLVTGEGQQKGKAVDVVLPRIPDTEDGRDDGLIEIDNSAPIEKPDNDCDCGCNHEFIELSEYSGDTDNGSDDDNGFLEL